MKRKSLRLVIPILIVLGIAALFLFQESAQQTTHEAANQPDPLISVTKGSAGFGKGTFVKKVYDDPWEEWIDKET